MIRSSRLAVLAIALLAAPASAAMASPGIVKTEAPVARGDSLTVDTLHLTNDTAMPRAFFFHPGDTADAPTSDDVRFSHRITDRTRRGIQSVSLDSAFESLRTARDFGDGAFAGALLDACIDDLGVDQTTRFARDFSKYHKLPAAQYRRILQAIVDKANVRNRSSTG